MRDNINLVTLVFSVILGALSVFTKGQDFLLQIYWAPEILLSLCVISLVIFAGRLVWAKKRTQGFPGFTIAPRYSKRVRLAGAIVMVAVPLAAFAIWYSTFRISGATRHEIAALVTAGDISVSTKELVKAQEFYTQALEKDPRRADVKEKLKSVEDQLKGTKP